MKKINLMTADRRLTAEVFDYLYKQVWAWEYRDRLTKKIGEAQEVIDALEKARRTWDDDGQVDTKVREQQEIIKKYEDEYQKNDVPKTRYKFSDEMKQLTKDFEEAETRAQVYNAFVRFFDAYGVDADGTDFVDTLCNAVSGDSGTNNRKQVTTTGKNVIAKRTRAEFQRIVMRRLADKLIYTGLIRFYGPFNVRTSTESCEFDLELPSMVAQKAELEIAKQKARAEKRAKRENKNK